MFHRSLFTILFWGFLLCVCAVMRLLMQPAGNNILFQWQMATEIASFPSFAKFSTSLAFFPLYNPKTCIRILSF